MSDERVTVEDAPERSRFEISVDGERVGYTTYREEQGALVFPHTIIDPGHEGEGLGSALIGGALAAVRASHRQIVPLCPFVAAYIEHHPELADLVDQQALDRRRS